MKKLLIATFLLVAVIGTALLFGGEIAFAEDVAEPTAQEAAGGASGGDLVSWVESNLEKIMTAGGGIVGIIAVSLINGLKKKTTVTALSNINLNNEIKSQAGTVVGVVEKIKDYEARFDSIVDKIDTLTTQVATSTTDDKLNALANILYKAYMHSGLDETVKSSIEGLYNGIMTDDAVYQTQIKQLEDTVAALNAQLSELK